MMMMTVMIQPMLILILVKRINVLNSLSLNVMNRLLVELIIFILKTKKKESNELFQSRCWSEIMKQLVSLLLIKRKIDYLMQNIFQILFEYLYLNILFLHSFFFQIIFIFLFF